MTRNELLDALARAGANPAPDTPIEVLQAMYDALQALDD